MADGFPNDADGDALRRIADLGSDLSRPMFVNFQVAVPDEESAKELAAVARKLGYRVSVYDSSDCALPWTSECSTRMVVTYESVLAIQDELAEISRPFGGFPDGWGTFGNGPTGQPPVE
jgi:signal recognition particle subunit SEC65